MSDTNCTLYLVGIPESLNTIMYLQRHFTRFEVETVKIKCKGNFNLAAIVFKTHTARTAINHFKPPIEMPSTKILWEDPRLIDRLRTAAKVTIEPTCDICGKVFSQILKVLNVITSAKLCHYGDAITIQLTQCQIKMFLPVVLHIWHLLKLQNQHQWLIHLLHPK